MASKLNMKRAYYVTKTSILPIVTVLMPLVLLLALLMLLLIPASSRPSPNASARDRAVRHRLAVIKVFGRRGRHFIAFSQPTGSFSNSEFGRYQIGRQSVYAAAPVKSGKASASSH